MRSFDRIAATIDVAPRLFRGPAPRKSPPLHLYRFPRYRGQLIGCCVGESGAASGETSVQTPDPLRPESKPTGLEVKMSPLGTYWAARRETAKYDRSILRGEGAIVSDGLAAMLRDGFIRWEDWPASDEAYRAYRDDRPPAGIDAMPKHKAIGDARRLEDADQVLEYMAAGYSPWVGLPWRGGFETRQGPDGRHRFSWRNAVAGGHAIEFLGYDLDADELAVGNSWMNAGWGDPVTGVAWCKWSEIARDLSAAALRSGQSEAVVFAEVEGEWHPKARPIDWADVLDRI